MFAFIFPVRVEVLQNYPLGLGVVLEVVLFEFLNKSSWELVRVVSDVDEEEG